MARRDPTALAQLKVRMREPLRARLEQDAKRRGVSINAEIVDRLERAADHQGLLSEALSLTDGKEFAGLLLFLGAAMTFAEFSYALNNRPATGRRRMWTSDPDAYEQCVQAAATVLEAMRPDGPVKAQPEWGAWA